MSLHKTLSSSWALPIIGLGAALLSAGCGGGGGGGGGPELTTKAVSSVTETGTPYTLLTTDILNDVQVIGGQVVISGVLGANSTGEVLVNGTAMVVPQTITGATAYTPYFMAGGIVYGTYTDVNGNQDGFAWTTTSQTTTDLANMVPDTVSPSGTFVAFDTVTVDANGNDLVTSTVLNVATGKSTTIAPSAGQQFLIDAVADNGSGIGYSQALPSVMRMADVIERIKIRHAMMHPVTKSALRAAAASLLRRPTTATDIGEVRFAANGTVSPNALQGTAVFVSLQANAVGTDGTVAGTLTDANNNTAPGVYTTTSTSPTILTFPGSTATTYNGVALALNNGDAVGGYYMATNTTTSATFQSAIAWTAGAGFPSNYIDFNNSKFALTGGATLSLVGLFIPNSLNFIGEVTASDGVTQSIQAFNMH